MMLKKLQEPCTINEIIDPSPTICTAFDSPGDKSRFGHNAGKENMQVCFVFLPYHTINSYEK